ncbi:MAG: trypsin-like peptidase domain-containing protein [Proteobacteria bacterium]|nr:trypsin-like peptidase domain-containing protein [Pseudomonadota bacterium]
MRATLDLDRLAVFQVFTGGGTGSGFLLEPRLLVTNCHVVAPYRRVAIEGRDRRRVLGTVRRLHPKRDLALVELAETLDGELLSLAALDVLRAQQTVHIVGFPVGLPLSVTEGVVSNPKQQFEGLEYVQTDAAINPGNSGGPMLDERKQIVAVTTCKLVAADMVGFGVPSSAVRDFVEGFRGQTAPFGIICPSCGELLLTAARYCASCGTDLEELELDAHFDPPEDDPVVAFVEGALRQARVDPVLARHGTHNWSFHSGSALIKVWSCCSEHLCFSSPLVQPGKQQLGELFRYLLAPEHAPFAFDLDDDVIRLNLTFHMADVFGGTHDEAAGWIAQFVAAADRFDNVLIQRFGCLPAPETQLAFLNDQNS